jgi:hypothetical protein
MEQMNQEQKEQQEQIATIDDTVWHDMGTRFHWSGDFRSRYDYYSRIVMLARFTVADPMIVPTHPKIHRKEQKPDVQPPAPEHVCQGTGKRRVCRPPGDVQGLGDAERARSMRVVFSAVSRLLTVTPGGGWMTTSCWWIGPSSTGTISATPTSGFPSAAAPPPTAPEPVADELRYPDGHPGLLHGLAL